MFTDTYRRFLEDQAIDEEIETMEEEIEAKKASLARQQENMAWRRCGFRSHRYTTYVSEPDGSISKGDYDYVIKTMERRYEIGEFGEPPDFDLVGYNEAMKQMLNEEMEPDTDEEELLAHPPLFSQARAVTMKFDKLNTVCSLRTKKELLQFRKGASGCIGAEVLFESEEVQKEVVIPAGVKVLVLKHSKRNSKPEKPDPDGSVVYVTEESHEGKRPDDTAKIENAMRATADPLPFAPGEWQGDP